MRGRGVCSPSHHGCALPVAQEGLLSGFCGVGFYLNAMSSRGIWGRVRERLRRFPELLESCGEQASIYGRCVASHTAGHRDLKKDACAKEFEMLMDCITKAAKKTVK